MRVNVAVSGDPWRHTTKPGVPRRGYGECRKVQMDTPILQSRHSLFDRQTDPVLDIRLAQPAKALSDWRHFRVFPVARRRIIRSHHLARINRRLRCWHFVAMIQHTWTCAVMRRCMGQILHGVGWRFAVDEQRYHSPLPAALIDGEVDLPQYLYKPKTWNPIELNVEIG